MDIVLDPIYYIYRRDTGEFAGSGVTLYDTETHGSTTVPTTGENQVWDGSAWVSPTVERLREAMAAIGDVLASKHTMTVKLADIATIKDNALNSDGSG